MKAKVIGLYEERYYRSTETKYDFIGYKIEYDGTYKVNKWGYKVGSTKSKLSTTITGTIAGSKKKLMEIEKTEKNISLSLAVKK